ncbi:MAG: T9SS type B sorting domain-containing protein [Winogradskyella sp.]|nr:MAG: T9SS type B sorting domain-containing protein [Winogradskyella sp.]
MKKLLVLIVFTILGLSINAQQEASNWYFGDNAGIRFDQDGTITALSDGQLSTDEGCTSISDKDTGALLFYTDGITVFDANGNIMANGTGLHGSPSSTQSAIIIPKPMDNDIYYVFTVDTNSFDQTDLGFKYSEVDITLNGGLGQVTQKNIALLQDSSEKIAAVLKDCQSESIWVVTLANEFGTLTNPFAFNTFHAFEVTSTGVNTTAMTSPAGVAISDQRGYLKFSPDGTKLASANAQGGLFLYDFDLDNGIVTGAPTPLNVNSTNNANAEYGLEFSPNSDLLYVSSSNDFFSQAPGQNNNPANHFSSLVQFDITAADIQGSQIILNQKNGYRSALQLGPDGKIYRTNSETYNNGLRYLTFINNPNEVGLACDYDDAANRVNLTNNSRQGLPPFIASFFVETIDIINNPNITTTFLPLCEGESYTLMADNILGATYTWSFDGIMQPTPPISYEFEVFQNGLYEVLIELNNGDCETFEGEAFVQYSPFPEAYTPQKIDVCDDDLNDDQYRFDLTQQDTFALGGQDPNDFTVHYYTSEIDAINDENEITGLYENTTNPEEIFVGVKSVTNRNCFKTTDENTGLPISFFIEVFDTPVITTLDDILLCDTEGDTTDGVVTTILSNLDADILGANQLASDYTITYHGTQNDANNAGIELPDNYQNTPFTDEVFVRMVNNNNTACVTLDSFTITINLTPQINNIGLFQCDEDGIPDARTVFNILEKEDDITGGNPDFSVAYYLNMGDAIAETDPIDASNYTNISTPQIIIARVTDTNSDCFSFSEVTLEVSATSANDAYLGICDTDGDEDGFIDFDLSMADAQVLDGLPAGLDLVYYESLDDALLEINPLANNYRNTTAFNQTLFVRVENNNDCYGINEIELEVLTLPNVVIEEEILYCLNTFPEKIKINGGVINDIPNNYYYNWSTGETTIEIEVNEPGTYTVMVSNVAGCSKERTVTVLASNTATIDNIEVTDTSENNSITVLVSGEGDYEYALEDPNGIYQDSNVFENVIPGIYTVFVRDKNGCGITEDMVSVVGFPKFFTPNGDNQNDFWQVKGISSQFQPGTIIYIYDRHGKLVSEVNPLGSGWDGNYNGNPLPSSDYWFSVTLEDGRRFSSHFALKR